MVLFEIWSLGHRPFDACNIEKDVSLRPIPEFMFSQVWESVLVAMCV